MSFLLIPERKSFATFCKFTGLLLIGLYSFLCSIFQQGIAHWRVELPQLSFPIFLGEVILFLCLILLVCVFLAEQKTFQKWHTLVLAYVIWLLIKAFTGYMYGGALAFRKAALFYYPFFGLCGYYFYDKKFFNQRNIILLLLIMLALFFHGSGFRYHIFSYLILFTVLWWHVKSKWVKTLLIVFFFISYPFYGLFKSSRTALISFCFVVFFIFFASLKTIKYKNQKQAWLTIFIGISIVVLTIGIMLFLNKHRVRNTFNFSKLIEIYQNNDAIFKEKQKNGFTLRKLKPKLFSEDRDLLNFSNMTSPTYEVVAERILEMKKDAPQEKAKESIKNQLYVNLSEENSNVQQVHDSGISEESFSTKDKMIKFKVFKVSERNVPKNNNSSADSKPVERMRPKKEQRGADVELGNVLFRIYIWQDMYEELINEKAIWGISFGKPQRSKRIEMLEVGKGEWSRDGWITPHNAYLHIIYCAGIIGMFLIFLIIKLFVSTVKPFIQLKSFPGIMLCGLLLFWLILSSFLVILEFPYNAIPFWTLWGMVLAYGTNLKLNHSL